uniref:Uncharacterized protein n=1 Tax=Leersia perrieri TaxID=77586 RepID=A0A0D9WX80_9ORYZ
MTRTGTRFREELRSGAVRRPCGKIGLKSDVLRLTSANGGIRSRLRWSLDPERSRMLGIEGPDGQTGGIGMVRPAAWSDQRHRRGQTGFAQAQEYVDLWQRLQQRKILTADKLQIRGWPKNFQFVPCAVSTRKPRICSWDAPLRSKSGKGYFSS